jgi:chromosome segregation ATPase
VLNYFKSKKLLSETDNTLKRRILDLDNEVTQREREKYFADKMKLISDYEGRIITESAKAADERELKMLELVEQKEERIKKLELENIDLRAGYRRFKDEVREHEILMHELNIDIQSAMTTIKTLAGKFESMEYRMGRVSERIEKKDVRMIEEGKG